MPKALPAADPIPGRPINRRHVGFCHSVARGESLLGAYTCWIGKAESRRASLQERASRMRSRFADYIASLRHRYATAADQAEIASKAQLMRFASRIIETPIGQITADSDLAQEITTTPTEHGPQVKIKMPSKLDAATLISRLAGYDAATQVNHAVSMRLDCPALDAIAAMLSQPIRDVTPTIHAQNVETIALPDEALHAQNVRSETSQTQVKQAQGQADERLEMHQPLAQIAPHAPAPSASWLPLDSAQREQTP